MNCIMDVLGVYEGNSVRFIRSAYERVRNKTDAWYREIQAGNREAVLTRLDNFDCIKAVGIDGNFMLFKIDVSSSVHFLKLYKYLRN